MTRRGFPLLLAVLALAACDGTGKGLDAWRAGRRAEALVAWREEAKARGEEASAPLLYDWALAALATGEVDEADAAARRAGERGGAAFAARSDFLRGNVAFARSERIEALAKQAPPDPIVMERVRAYAEDALALWRKALLASPGWPEAERNVERALLRIAALRDRASSRGPKPSVPKPPSPPPTPPPVKPPPTPTPETPRPDGAPEVSSADVARLLDILRRKEQEKWDRRRAERHAPAAGGDLDR